MSSCPGSQSSTIGVARGHGIAAPPPVRVRIWPADGRRPGGEVPDVVTAAPQDQWRLLDVQAHDTRLAQLAHRRRTLPEHAELERLQLRRRALADELVAAAHRQPPTCAASSRRPRPTSSRCAAASPATTHGSQSGQGSAKDMQALQHELGAARASARASSRTPSSRSWRARGRRGAGGRARGASAAGSTARSVRSNAAPRRNRGRHRRRGRHGVRSSRGRGRGRLRATCSRSTRRSATATAASARRGCYQRRCEGCRLELNPTRHRAHPLGRHDAVLRCEECGRILVRTPTRVCEWSVRGRRAPLVVEADGGSRGNPGPAGSGRSSGTARPARSWPRSRSRSAWPRTTWRSTGACWPGCGPPPPSIPGRASRSGWTPGSSSSRCRAAGRSGTRTCAGSRARPAAACPAVPRGLHLGAARAERARGPARQRGHGHRLRRHHRSPAPCCRPAARGRPSPPPARHRPRARRRARHARRRAARPDGRAPSAASSPGATAPTRRSRPVRRGGRRPPRRPPSTARRRRLAGAGRPRRHRGGREPAAAGAGHGEGRRRAARRRRRHRRRLGWR